jgi:S-methylmethionine-dependent homocysteine/selenocysteine methylase
MASRDRSRKPAVRILDGGFGSELRRRGAALSAQCWSAGTNLTQADLVFDIHADYVRAGADIVTANTFATSRFVLAAAGLDSRFDEINRAAIAAARRAADSAQRTVCVAASISCLPPSFDAGAYPDSDAEYAAYSELAECFVENGADLILLEMMQDTEHAPRACRAARAAGLPFWIGISCRLSPRDETLVAFDDLELPFAAMLDAVLPFEPEGFAVMHSPIDAIGPALEVLRGRWSGALGAYAEIPYPEDPSASAAVAIGPADYGRVARGWIERGATLVGGCCGTTPAHIEALSGLAGD